MLSAWLSSSLLCYDIDVTMMALTLLIYIKVMVQRKTNMSAQGIGSLYVYGVHLVGLLVSVGWFCFVIDGRM